jgi:uncharacterized protein YcaQ
VSHHRSISAATARRFLVRRHLLAPPRALPPEPASVMRVMDRLGSLQFDPLEVAGRNHDLTLLARVAGYRRAWTDDLLYRDRVLYETFNKMLSLVPTAELPWYRITWDRHRTGHDGGTFDEHAPLVEELLGRIRDGGPLSSTDVEPRAAIDWYWRPTNQVRAILEALGEAGILGIARREGNRRVYDLVERLFPPELLARRVPEREQLRHKLLSRFRGTGLLGATGEYSLWAGTGATAARASPATAAPGRTACCTGTGSSTRPSTRCSRWCRRPSCRGTGSPGTGCTRSTRAARSTSTHRSWRSSWRGFGWTDRCRPRT